MNIDRNLTLCAAVLGAAFGSAFAAPPAVDAAATKAVTAAISKLVPGASVDSIEPSPIPGVYLVVASGQVAYVSADGKYLLHGAMFDIDQRIDLTAQRMDGIRKDVLAGVPASKHVEFAPEKPKYRVTVFTDFDCGYCRKMHAHMDEYNKAGIAVDYLFFPRTGLGTPSFDKAVSVWCAKDRHRAFTEAKQGAEPPHASCANPVAEEYALGQRLGITGTPTVVARDGSVIGGYLTPQEMVQQLEAVEARRAPK